MVGLLLVVKHDGLDGIIVETAVEGLGVELDLGGVGDEQPLFVADS